MQLLGNRAVTLGSGIQNIWIDMSAQLQLRIHEYEMIQENKGKACSH